MHELQLSQQVGWQKTSAKTRHGRPGAIPLRVCQHSLLADHTLEVLQTRFQMAELGKPVQEVQLEIETIPPKETWLSCGMVVEKLDDTVTCPSWATGPVLWKDEPEVLLQEID